MTYPVLTEKDLEIIFSGKKKPKRKSPVLKNILYVLFFVSLVVVIYATMNFNSLGQNFNFWYNNEYKIAPLDSVSQNLVNIIPTTKNAVLPEIDNNSLYLPIINIKAPITFGVPNTPETVASSLKEGVIQIKGSAIPGEIGNVFITGHSSNYPWAKGKYNNVFALLNKFVVGDVAQIKYNNTNYIYKVSEIKVVEATDISVLQSKNESILTLMTCTPVGTSLRRLIVSFNQTYPNPISNKLIKSSGTGSVLPRVH